MERITIAMALLLVVVMSAHAADITIEAHGSSYLDTTRTPNDAVGATATHWESAAGDTNGFVVIDMGDTYDVTNIMVETLDSARGATDIDLTGSFDDITYPITFGTGLTLTKGITNSFDVEGLARYIKVQINSGNDGTFTALDGLFVSGTFNTDLKDSLLTEISVSSVSNSGATGAHTDTTVDGRGITNTWYHTATLGSSNFFLGLSTNIFVEYDLGTTQGIGTLQVWNYNRGAGRDVAFADIEVSTNGTTWTLVKSNFSFHMGPQTDSFYGSQLIDMGNVLASLVRISTTNVSPEGQTWAVVASGGSGGDFAGLSEVRFWAEQVVNPSAAAGSVTLVPNAASLINADSLIHPNP